MNHLSGLFYTGYAATMPGIYFNRVLLISQNIQNPDEKIKQAMLDYFEMLKTQGGDNVRLITLAADNCRKLGIDIKPLPKFPNDFFDWQADLVKGFNEKFGPVSLEYHCFHFALGATMALVNLSLIQSALVLGLKSEGRFNILKDVAVWIKEFDQFLFRVRVPSVFLENKTNLSVFKETYNVLERCQTDLTPKIPTSFDKDSVDTFTALLDLYLKETGEQIKKCVGELNK